MAERPEDVHLDNDEVMSFSSEDEEPIDDNHMEVHNPGEEVPNANDRVPEEDDGGEFVIRPEELDEEILVSDSEESDEEILVSDSEESDEEISVDDSEESFEEALSSDLGESDEELLITDSEESEGEEVEVHDSDEDSEAGPEENDGYHTGIFREFFKLNVERNGLDAPMCAQGKVRKFEKLLLEIAKILRYKESYASLLASLKTANMQFDNCSFPTTMNGLWKLLGRNSNNFDQSIVCGICWENLGTAKVPTRNCQCGRTGPGKTDRLGTFLYLNLPAQLQGLLGKTGMATALQYPWTRVKRNPDAMEDVYDALVYRNLCADGEFLSRGSHNYSLAIWTDRVNSRALAPVKIWPVFVQVLELSPRARQRNSLLAALYVGPTKPLMGEFLLPFAKQLRDLHSNGITWRPDGGAEVRSRFVTLIVASDSEAKYQLMPSTRHSDFCGCIFCYAVGVRRAGPGQSHIYPYNDGDDNNRIHFAADRTDEEIRRDSRAAAETGQPVNGLRSLSDFCIVPGVDLRICRLVEGSYLWERNFPRLYRLITDPATPNYLTSEKIEEISKNIQLIKPPTKLGRRPRSLENFAKYKATEYRNLAWFYWLPCAHHHMSAEHIEHFGLFAEATYVLNMDSILPADLDRVRDIINTFRQQSAELFDESHQTYGLHLLKHVVRCVEELGPQWVSPGFWLESLHRTIKNSITSRNNRSMQIACRILLTQFVEKCLDWDMSPAVRRLLQELMNKKRWVVPPQNETGQFINHAKGVPSGLDQREIAALIAAGYPDVNEELEITRYKRVNIDGISYQTPSDRPVNYDNSVIHVTPPINYDRLEFIRISSIISWQRGTERNDGVIGSKFTTVRTAFNTTYMRIVQESPDLVYFPLESIKAPAVLVESLGTIYISPLPNRWDVP